MKQLSRLLGLLLLAAPCCTLAQSPAPPDLGPRIARAAERIAAIDHRAGRVGDYDELKNLQEIYGYYVDKALWDEVVDLFAEDGSLELGFNGVYVGKAAIRKYLYSLTEGRPGLLKGQLNNHAQFSPVITLGADGRTARARWQQWILDGIYGAGSGGNWGAGTYENEYVKEDGVWKLRTVHLYLRFYAPYEGGWTRAAPETAYRYARSKVKPTRPPSVAYAPYPASFEPPFHDDRPERAGALLSADDATRPTPAPAKTVTDLEAQVRALELKLDRLKAVGEVENMEATYGFYVDKSLPDAISALFAQNSTLEILGRGVFIGLDRVYEYMRRLSAPAQGSLFNHMPLQPVVHVSADGNLAFVRARLLVMAGGTGRPAQWGDGIYENVFVKDNGTWKFLNLMGTQGFYADYDGGPAKKPVPMLSYFPGYPPDQLTSLKYEAYPAQFVTPFHYKNPVSGK
jgi:SnoaL-like domain